MRPSTALVSSSVVRLGLCIALPIATTTAQETFVVAPRAADRATLAREILDPARTLPDPAADSGPEAPRALYAVARRLATATVPDGDGGTTTFGDVLATCLKLDAHPKAQRVVLARLERDRPAFWRESGALLADVVRDQRLDTDAWDPGEAADDDGFHFGAPLRFGTPPLPAWPGEPDATVVQQAVCLIRADLVAIETAENDYTRYQRHVAEKYDWIRPVDGTLLRGADDDGPFTGLRIDFQNDLPWPFGHYRCDLRLVKTLDADGHLVTRTYSDSDDVAWYASATALIPVRDGEGDFVAMLCVRWTGFDLAGVPDGDGDVRSALRFVIGNLKRDAEAEFARRDPERRLVLDGAIPAVTVRGSRDDR